MPAESRRYLSGDRSVAWYGPDGPIDSIRWEVFAESLQDDAILQAAGIGPGNEMLADINSYADLPKSEQWIADALARVLGRN